MEVNVVPDPARPTASAGRRALRFPLARGAIAVAGVLGAVLAIQAVAKALPIPKTAGLIVTAVLGIPAIVLVLRAHARWIEGREATELEARGALGEIAIGAAIGAALFATTIGVLAAVGAYHVTGVNDAFLLVGPLFGALLSAVMEEALFRGIVFRITQESLGSWLALAVSAVIFGAVHLMNPNASAWGAISIIIEAGVLLAAAYMFTRRLWLPIGLHFAWNFAESGIFGVTVSGIEVKGLLRSTLRGPTWLSGGSFGAEASVVAVMLCLAVGVAFVVAAMRRGHVVPPPWRRAPGR